jgi:hypothetical protein
VTSSSSRSADAENPTTAAAATTALRDQIVEVIEEVIEEVKPRLRGWLHLSAVPLTLAAGVLLVGLSPPGHRGQVRSSSQPAHWSCSVSRPHCTAGDGARAWGDW